MVERENIKVTIDLLKEFADYMHGLHRKTAEQQALNMGIRNDPYQIDGKSHGAV